MMRRMESGRRFFFDPSSHGDVLFLGKADRDPPFQGGGRWSVMKMEESLKRRPCSLFSCPQFVYDDEYYEEQSSDKKRRLTSQQVHLLEKSFEEEKKLEPERKMELANKLGLPPRQLAIWFQNRRARCKAKQLERDYHQLKSSHNYLLSRYNSLLKQNEKLKAQVDLLTKKLQGDGNGESDGSSKQLLADLDYYSDNTYFRTDGDMNHASNCLPPHATTDEPLGWFWS